MKDRSIVLNVMAGSSGEVLDRNRAHIVKKDENGNVFAEFRNPTQEENAVKLTLTALNPHARFAVTVNGADAGVKTANAAGILECRIPLPGRSQLTVRQIS